jgi:O-antigen ligase
MKKLFYVYILGYSLFPYNLDSVPLLAVPPVQIYVGDLLTGIALLLIVSGLIRWKSDISGKVEWPYLVFLGWLMVCVATGFQLYGYRALGESRTIVHFFSFFMPYALIIPGKGDDPDTVTGLALKAILFSGTLAAIMFFVGPIFDISQMDFRGERSLNSNQTFFLLLASCTMLVFTVRKLALRPHQVLLGLFFFGVAVLSKNRTALASMSVVFVIYMFFSGRFRHLVVAVAPLLLAASLLVYVLPRETSDVTTALEGIGDPLEDPNYGWRLMVQAAALEQGVETMWLGQGYGGYFSYVIEDQGNLHVEEVTPHNQFVTLFLKSGLVGVSLCLFAMFWVLYHGRRTLVGPHGTAKERALLVVLLLAIASQLLYGFGYDFHALFGMYIGFATILVRGLGVGKDRSAIGPDAITFGTSP